MIKKKWDMFAESVSMSLSNIAGNKMRTFLTTLGIIIGVGAIIALMTVVQGATDTITPSLTRWVWARCASPWRAQRLSMA